MHHTIVQIEENGLVLTIAQVGPRSMNIVRCLRVPGRAGSPDELAQTVAALLLEEEGASREVHLVLGDRRFQHFQTVVPRLANDDLQALLAREAVRRAGLSGPVPQLLRGRVLRTEPGGRLAVAATAIASSVVDPMIAAFGRVGMRVATLHSVEGCLAGVAEAGERTAVLEVEQGRARFCICDGGEPVLVRRFLVHAGGAHEDASMLVAQLSVELPRTLEFLRDNQVEPPQRLLVGPHVARGEEDLAMLGDGLRQRSIVAPEWQLADAQEVPGLAVLGLLRRLRSRRLASLLGDQRIGMPPQRLWIAAAAALLLGSAAAIVIGVERQQAESLALAEFASVELDRMQVERELAALDGALGAPGGETAAGGSSRLRAALQLRRPFSRAFAELCTAVPASVKLHELRFDGHETVALRGQVAADTRIAMLGALAELTARLRGAGWFATVGARDIEDVPGQQAMSFAMTLHWRLP